MTELRLAKRAPREGGGRSADEPASATPPVIPSAIVAALPSAWPGMGAERDVTLATAAAVAPLAVPTAVVPPATALAVVTPVVSPDGAEDRGRVASTLPAGIGFGARLATERLRQRLSVGDVATRLRLHPNQIRAIEGENLAALPSAPYVRGFVRNYARVLGIEAQPLLDALAAQLAPPRTIDARTAPGSGAAAGSIGRRGSSPAWSTGADAALRPLVLAGGILALAVFAALGWFATHRSVVVPAPQETIATPSPAVPIATDAAGGAAVAAGPGASAPVVAMPKPDASAAPSVAVRIPDNALLLRFAELAWVQVAQADGRIVLSQNNPAGSEQVVAGQPPFRITVGNAQGVRIEFRGRDVDLRPHTVSGNVARLTIE
jgi:cytoskeleton protein RodZ